ncbi:MAG: hypothetical protein QG621_664 [Patescibacteria group bacterium]|nr:hypothetical protein [Patescibacteria group bacterium]
MQKRRSVVALACMLVALVGAWWLAAHSTSDELAGALHDQVILISHTTIGSTEKFFGTLPLASCDELAMSIAATASAPTQLSLHFTTTRVQGTCTSGAEPAPFAAAYTAAGGVTLSTVTLNGQPIPFKLQKKTP